MTATLKKTRDELVKKLTPKQRMDLAQALIVSVQCPPPTRSEKEWEKELDRRLDEYEAGRATLISSEESFALARKALNESRRASLRSKS
jgi:putative addiction module component (TIGR02574 family)